MSPRRRNPSSWLQIPLIFTFYIFLQVVQVAYAQPTNITVEDDDPSIRYSPPAAWGWSWDELPTILSSFDGGGNKVARIMKRDPQYPSVEYDRIGGGTGTSSDPDPYPASDTNLSPPVPGTKRRRTLSSQARLRTGGKDDQSRSQLPKEMHSATLQFDFTGSAIYFFAYSRPPPFSILIDGKPQILPALSFTPLPDHPPRPSPDNAGPSYRSRIFYSNRTLGEGRHSVTLTFPLLPGKDIAFALERIVYTQNVTPASSPSTPSPAYRHLRRQEPSSTSSSGTATESEPPASTSPAPTDPSKKRNIATFAAAVGGSVGLLALFSAGLALSIIRRRYRAKRREREDRERRPEFPDPLDPSSSQDVRRTVRRAQVFGDEGIFGGRTRRNGQGRDMEERRGGSFSSDSSFVPRFFPGTEVPPPAQAATLTTTQGRRGSARNGSLDEPPPPMYNDALEAPVVPPPGLVTHHPYIHRPRVDRRASLDSNEELGLPIAGREGGGVVGREDLSYADIPPSDPPPPEVVAASVGAPPSFPEAMASASSLPVAPLPVHQARSTRSFNSARSNTRLHQGGVQSQRRPEAAPLLHPTSSSRLASASSSVGSLRGAGHDEVD